MAQSLGSSPKGLMAYSVGGTSINEYWSMIKIPVMVLIGLSVVNFLIGCIAFFPSMSFAGLRKIVDLVFLVIVLVMGFVSGYIGYSVVKNHRGNLMTAIYAGAIGGIIDGEVLAVLDIIWSILAMVLPSATPSRLILSIVGIALFPIMGAIIGIIMAVIGGVIAGAKSFGPAKR